MVGIKRITVRMVVLGLVLLGNHGAAQEPVPVVSLKQPSRMTDGCDCKCCGLGLPCELPDAQSPAFVVECVTPAEPPSTASVVDYAIMPDVIESPSAASVDEVPLEDEPSVLWISHTETYQNCDDATCRCKRTASRRCNAHSCPTWNCANLCCQRGFWIRADYLMWWTQEHEIPSLVTASPLGTPIDDAGVMGLPTTTNVFGGPLFGDLRNGGRLRFGGWAGRGGCGLDGSLWGIENQDDALLWSSSGSPAYARPFFNADPLVNGPDAQLVSFEGILAGSVAVNSSSELLGGDLGLRYNLCCSSESCRAGSYRVDFYTGYRYFKLREGLRISEKLESIAAGGPVAQGTTAELFDDFQSRHEFHGANLGLVAARQSGRWTSELSTRIAIGNLARRVAIDGGTSVTVPGQSTVSRSGGLLAQASNIGNYEDAEFAILPEVRADLGYNLTRDTKLLVGYTFMYLGEVVRPGDVIDSTVNGLQLDPTLPFVGPERPQFRWNESTMWVMGLNLGVEFTF